MFVCTRRQLLPKSPEPTRNWRKMSLFQRAKEVLIQREYSLNHPQRRASIASLSCSLFPHSQFHPRAFSRGMDILVHFKNPNNTHKHVKENRGWFVSDEMLSEGRTRKQRRTFRNVCCKYGEHALHPKNDRTKDQGLHYLGIHPKRQNQWIPSFLLIIIHSILVCLNQGLQS